MGCTLIICIIYRGWMVTTDALVFKKMDRENWD